MIVFDASTIVSAAFRLGSVPNQAVRQAFRADRIAVSDAVMAELLDVLHRPRLAGLIDPGQRAELLGLFDALGIVFAPTLTVTDCRDAKDNKYLELAQAADAETIVSSDNDLLVLHPWRDVRILLPAAYLAEARGND